jgi:hypothetical protein
MAIAADRQSSGSFRLPPSLSVWLSRLIPLLGLGLTLFWTRSASIDDAYISYRYARNLDAGHGLVLNAKEHVEAISNALWTILLALLHLVAIPLPLAGMLLGILSLAATVLLTRSLMLGFGASQALAGATALGVGITTDLVAGSTMGLEGGLFSALLLAALVTWTRTGRGQVLLVLVLVSLGATRPEGLVLGGALAVLRLSGPRVEFRSKAPVSVAALAGLGLIEIVRFSYYGEWLPMSVTAKRDIGLSILQSLHLHLRAGAKYLVLGIGIPIAVAVTLLLPAAAWIMRERLRRRLRVKIHPVVAPAVLILALGLALPLFSGGDWMPYSRLVAPYLPVIYVLVALGVRLGLPRAPVIAMLAPLLLAAVGHHQLPLRDNGLNALSSDRGFDGLGRAVAASGLGRRVLATDVLGRLCFYAPDVRCSDMYGLSEPMIANKKGAGSIYGKVDFKFTLSRRPAVVATDYWPNIEKLLAARQAGDVPYVALVGARLTDERVFVLVDPAFATRIRTATAHYLDRTATLMAAQAALSEWRTKVKG